MATLILHVGTVVREGWVTLPRSLSWMVVGGHLNPGSRAVLLSTASEQGCVPPENSILDGGRGL